MYADCQFQWVGSVSPSCSKGTDALQACYLEVSVVTGVWPECDPNKKLIQAAARAHEPHSVCKGKAPGHALKAYKREAVVSHAFVTSTVYCEIQIHDPATYQLRKIAVPIQ